MIAILTLLCVVALSMLVVRVGTIALTMTGLPEEAASFQAISAFSGVGFSTGEFEQVMDTAPRRRVPRWLMRLGSAGLVTVITTTILSFRGPTPWSRSASASSWAGWSCWSASRRVAGSTAS